MWAKGMSVDILVDKPEENAEICSWMHCKKVVDFQRPSFWMVWASAPFKWRAMAPPARREWLLMSEGSWPRVQRPMSPAACFKRTVDVVGCDGPVTGVEGMFDTVDGCVMGATIGQNVVHSSSQGFDGTVHGLGAVLGDALTFSAILLAGNDNGCCCGLVELVQGCRVGDDVLSLPESDIFHSKRNGVACATCSRWGVLTNSQQIVQCNVAQVSLGFPMGTVTMLGGVAPS